MVHDFIRNCISYNSERLQLLLFIGVDLLIGSPEEFQTMLDLADEVEWDERCLSWAANLDCFEAMMSA